MLMSTLSFKRFWRFFSRNALLLIMYTFPSAHMPICIISLKWKTLKLESYLMGAMPTLLLNCKEFMRKKPVFAICKIASFNNRFAKNEFFVEYLHQQSNQLKLINASLVMFHFFLLVRYGCLGECNTKNACNASSFWHHFVGEIS